MSKLSKDHTLDLTNSEYALIGSLLNIVVMAALAAPAVSALFRFGMNNRTTEQLDAGIAVFQVVVGVFGVLAFLLLVITRIHASHMKSVQLSLNSTAEQSGASNVPDKFVLFLRPLSPANAVECAVEGRTNRLVFGERWNLELALSMKLHPDYEVVAVGEKKFSIGAKKIFTPDEAWQALVGGLLNRCVAIVVVLEGSPGMVWELEQITANPKLLRKTIFVVPAECSEETRFETAVLPVFKARGLAIPIRLDFPQIFWFDGGSNDAQSTLFTRRVPRRLLEIVQRKEAGLDLKEFKKYIDTFGDEPPSTSRKADTFIDELGPRNFIWFFVIFTGLWLAFAGSFADMVVDWMR